MTEREFGNFGTWSLKELIEKERSFTAGDRRRDELRAEIDRRLAAEQRRAIPLNRLVTVLMVLAAIVTIVLGLNKGIYAGSTTTTNSRTEPAIGGGQKIVTATHKVCRYLFITGIAELPAAGGLKAANLPGYAVEEDPPSSPLPPASSLHCRFFAE